MFRLALCLLFLAAARPALAQRAADDEAEFFSLERASLEETLNIRTSVATRNPMKLRETPGLVTVITREEIQAGGARDLIDVLKLVPEFDFGMDVQGNLGLGVRGNWANEGKALLIWDGQVYNETLYATVQFDRFPVDQIDEIEIIRGPGSVIYGGFAELAVINVRTLPAKKLGGASAFAAYGQGEGARARNYAGLSYGKDFDGTEAAAKVFWGEAQRSDRRYTDFSGLSYNMNRTSDLRPASVNVSVAKSGLSARFIQDDYKLRDRDQFTTALATGSGKVGFPSFFAETRYDWRLSDTLRLEPKLNYARSMAWVEKDEHFTYDKKTERITGSLTAFHAPSDEVQLLAGGEYSHDAVKVEPVTAAASQYGSGRDRVYYENYALFGQATLHARPATIVAGARYDKHSKCGASLVPRLALTKQAGDFNFKAIYSSAFKAPSIENIRLASDNGFRIKPERTTVMEAEAGYKAGDLFYLYASASLTTINDPIIFYTDTSGNEYYRNYDRTGTLGYGFGLKYKNGAARLNADYTTYSAAGNRVDVYGVPGRGSYLLGFPRHKVTLNSSIPLAGALSANPSAIYISRRYGYAGNGSLRVFGERIMADFNLQLRDRPIKRLTLNLGVKDIFKSNYSYIQPYNGGHAPLPGPSREIFLKAGYEF
ncbi:MAG: TonB-dependent receptor plug domain-containing protein [Elusimicrobiales bacterium]|nr:TonB-dependent receptor plug domain-containing protein [Elusimicrobiales bacterium]